ncbi:MAG: glycosyltransferase [Methylicorpusculum sp.]|uniref:glycosyltransferase n=1 Tax=Methylicorpusculum sp. TaxID=2713644 RepID=UPI00271F2DBB|nr:glycosyltransferase [Methylicorpusculum sp.]MDO8939991.1 glycosyltransferase [Methylicorpusculum sp.]MDO9238470.1 glycosyltransferase [Methylicorpusculum sp.]MDP2203119.1 glycosyltransferase [Methylicorpusculum sp.]
MKAKTLTLFIISILLIINLSIWSYVNNPLKIPSWNKTMMGVTFSPMRRDSDPMNNRYPSLEQIEEDVSLLANKVYAIRTYSSLDGMEHVPEFALKNKLNVTMGAWIDTNLDKNRREIESLINLSNENSPTIVRLLVGNEVLLRNDIPVEQLIDYIREVKKRTWRPVSTSETWDRWIAHPELANEVDYIAVHILPYWEGISVEAAVDYIFFRYNAMKEAFPNKPIVITEVGWPSDGQAFKHATPSLTNQAKFLRQFLNRASKEKVNYYVIEAFDQPWKIAREGSSGAYWGIYNADRKPKFPMVGDVLAMPQWQDWATGAAIFSFILMGLFLFSRRQLKLPGLLFFGIIANIAASVLIWSASIAAQQYQTTFSIVFWLILLLMQALAILILLTESLEIAEVIWHRKSSRTFQPLKPESNFVFPKVSIHLPIHNEPPEMVRETLEALARIDYPEYEVLVLDNNTRDPAVWQPVRDDCERLGAKFRFFHLENWPGYKAGAINYGLDQTADDAEIIAVIDSDYIISPDWLKSMVPYFENDTVGFVQSPQDYRDLHENLFKQVCYWEYAGFFNIGMVQRNEYNAIIQHGTMTLIRKSALVETGRWSEWCICEDSELGLRLYEAGYDSVYCKESFGRGVMPDTFSGYMTQRFRWVYGAMMIIKHHWREFLPSKKSSLTTAQRYYFIAGWLPWFSDALALLLTIASLVMTALLVSDPLHSELPVNALLLPTIGLFGFKIIRTLWLYKARVNCSILQSFGAALSGLSLTHTVAKGTIQGLFTSGKPFMRTPKLEKQGPFIAGLATIWQELLLLSLLITAILSMHSLEHFDNLSGKLWIAVLSVQSVPYIASLLILLMSIAPNYLPSRKKS